MKAVVAETDATTMADSSVVANATQVVHEGTNKNTPEEMICTSRQKALAADIDLTPMAQSTPVADATQVDDRKKERGDVEQYKANTARGVMQKKLECKRKVSRSWYFPRFRL